MHSVKAVVGVPDVAIESVRLGQTQTVRCEATPGVVFNGTVTRIAPSADPSSRMFEVECTIPNVDNRLKAGMIASLELGREADARPAALVPLNSIVRPKSDPRGYATFVVEDAAGGAVARERPVQLGEVRGNLIAVTSGLAPGDRVVVVGATLIADGAEVVVVP
jgi:multidrug efflux system membrane fusion protein